MGNTTCRANKLCGPFTAIVEAMQPAGPEHMWMRHCAAALPHECYGGAMHATRAVWINMSLRRQARSDGGSRAGWC